MGQNKLVGQLMGVGLGRLARPIIELEKPSRGCGCTNYTLPEILRKFTAGQALIE